MIQPSPTQAVILHDHTPDNIKNMMDDIFENLNTLHALTIKQYILEKEIKTSSEKMSCIYLPLGI